jgi:alpha-L-fucosidase
MQKQWYEKTYRRLLFDMHINDWDSQFLSQFDPRAFVEAVKATGATAVTVPANNHAGLCFYPTQVGKEHGTVKGKDTLGTLIDLLHKNDLEVIVYYCTIYCDWYWDTHPEARIVDADGKSDKQLINSIGRPRRFSVSCMNNPAYREFVRSMTSRGVGRT